MPINPNIEKHLYGAVFFVLKILLSLDEKKKIQRTVFLWTLTDGWETTWHIALHAAGLKRNASEISMVNSGSNKFPTVKPIQCPSYDTVQQEDVIYLQAPSQAHVMPAMAALGQHPG